MADVTIGDVRGPFRIGDVIFASLQLVPGQYAPLLAVTAVLHLPNIYFYYIMHGAAARLTMARIGTVYGALAGIAIIDLVSRGVVCFAVFAALQSRSFDLLRSMRTGLARTPLVLMVGLCIGLVYVVGIVLLVVPGIIWALATMVAVPACVVERCDPTEAVKRSLDLTRGHRWRLLAINLIVNLPMVILGLVARQMALAFFGVGGAAVAQYACGSVMETFFAIVLAVVYRDLRRAKEGLGTERIVSVFE